MFFKTYTEKFGVFHAKNKQRICSSTHKGFKFFEILKQMLFKKNTPKN